MLWEKWAFTQQRANAGFESFGNTKEGIYNSTWKNLEKILGVSGIWAEYWRVSPMSTSGNRREGILSEGGAWGKLGKYLACFGNWVFAKFRVCVDMSWEMKLERGLRRNWGWEEVNTSLSAPCSAMPQRPGESSGKEATHGAHRWALGNRALAWEKDAEGSASETAIWRQ